MHIAKIVSSNSHIDYVARVIDALDSSSPPMPEDHCFGQFVGIVSGVAVSIALLLWRTSRPHIAIVGQVPGTEHFRNVLRHRVLTDDAVLSLRVDESLNFANARAIEGLRLVMAAPAVGALGVGPLACRKHGYQHAAAVAAAEPGEPVLQLGGGQRRLAADGTMHGGLRSNDVDGDPDASMTAA